LKPTLHAIRLTSTLALAALLASCGGGGGGTSTSAGSATPAAPDPAAGCKIQIVADSAVQQGKTAGATALSCGAPLNDITWTQVSGPSVELLAARSPTVAIETVGIATGVIGLRADAVLADGTTASASATISVGDAPAGTSFVTVRADHSVRPGTDTSLRAWPTLAAGDSLQSVTWTQTSGPTVTMNTAEPNVLMFKAPAVSADTVLQFRATMITTRGQTDTDDVMVGLDREAAAPDGYVFDVTARVHPYRQGGVYTAVLARCTYDVGLYYKDASNNSFCPVSTLPLLQADAGIGIGGVPSVAQIMSRVLVSHDFLGANFEQFLIQQDSSGDFRRMLAGVSAIVIGSHVRPSFYDPATGAIYLDADNLWLTATQRDVVTEVPDYRLAYDDLLNYSDAGRRVKDNAYARTYYDSAARVTRTLSDLRYELGSLLYHELSHASDFFPPAERTLDATKSIWANAVPRMVAMTLPSDALAAQYPLRSDEMKGLGQVLFEGATPTDAQKAYTASQVGGFFAGDVASDDYAYAINGSDNSREDLAMLFEEFMLGYRYGVRYDIAFTSKYQNGMDSNSLVVGWGERGRIAEPAVKPRIKLVLQRIAPWIDPGAVDTLPAPILMQPGSTWGQTLVLNPSALSGSSALRVESAAQRLQRSRDETRRRRRAELPLH